MHTQRVTWRRSRSIYATPQTHWVRTAEAQPTHDQVIEALVAAGHAEAPADVHLLQVLRRFVVEHPRYDKLANTRIQAAAHLLPGEQLGYVPNDGNHWGDDHSTYWAASVRPSTGFCTTCGVHTQSGPWAVFGTTQDGRSTTFGRNYPTHADAHETGDRLLAAGTARDYSVSLDTCG